MAKVVITIVAVIGTIVGCVSGIEMVRFSFVRHVGEEASFVVCLFAFVSTGGVI